VNKGELNAERCNVILQQRKSKMALIVVDEVTSLLPMHNAKAY